MRADGWDPDLPLGPDNHPPCDHCDLGVNDVPCSCFDWNFDGEEKVAS
jgi:hypothetical protein